MTQQVQDYRYVDIEIKHAKELYDKFYKQTYKYHTIYGVKKTNNISKETAKKLALIVVNEVLNEPKMRFLGDAIGDGNGCMDVHYRHWVNVKTLIEKM